MLICHSVFGVFITNMACNKTFNFSNSVSAAVTFIDRVNRDSFNTDIFMPCVLALGMLTNSAFLFTLLRVARMKTIPNAYFALQSITDIIFVNIVITPVVHAKLYGFHAGELPTSPLGCSLYYFVVSTSYPISLALTFFISFDRFYAITDPLKHKIYARRGIAKYTAIGFALCVLGAILTSLNRSRYIRSCYIWPDDQQFSSYPLYSHACRPLHPATGIVKWVAKTVPFLIVVTCTSWFYIKIIRVLNDKSIQKSTTSNQQVSVRNQVAKVVICNGIIFVVSFTPSIIAETIRIVDPNTHYPLLYIGDCSMFLNLVFNSVSFPVISPFYRQAYREAFCFSRGSSSPHRQQDQLGDSKKSESITGKNMEVSPNNV